MLSTFCMTWEVLTKIYLLSFSSVVSEIARNVAEARKKTLDLDIPSISVSHGKLSSLKPKVCTKLSM